MVGDKDVFECFDCDHTIVTVEKDKGRAPFIIPCMKNGCNGTMRSHFNNKVKVMGRPANYELRYPTEEEYEQMGVRFQEKVDDGNLLPFKTKNQNEDRLAPAVADAMRRTIG